MKGSMLNAKFIMDELEEKLEFFRETRSTSDLKSEIVRHL